MHIEQWGLKNQSRKGCRVRCGMCVAGVGSEEGGVGGGRWRAWETEGEGWRGREFDLPACCGWVGSVIWEVLAVVDCELNA